MASFLSLCLGLPRGRLMETESAACGFVSSISERGVFGWVGFYGFTETGLINLLFVS